ncbi:lysis protein [Escherichia coli]
MNISLKSLIVPGVILLLALASWLSYSSYKGEKKRADDAEQSLSLANDTIKDMQIRQRDVAALDAKYTGELADAKETIERLHSDVIAGRKRLQVAATCTKSTTGASSMGDGESPRLTADAELNYYRLRSGIDRMTAQVNYLQEYIRTQCLK